MGQDTVYLPASLRLYGPWGSRNLTGKQCADVSFCRPQGVNVARLPNAKKAGTLRIGGSISVNRLGFGAMRITGPGIWGEPEDRDEALRTLKHLPALGVNFVDTANSYGPEVSEKLIREALHPYVGVLVATKAGLTRSGPANGRRSGSPTT